MLVQLNGIKKTYNEGDQAVKVLTGVDLSMDRGESLSIMGPSGCGKSTLLHLLGTLDNPDLGVFTIGGKDPFGLDKAELALFRNRTLGFVFQDHHLLPQYSVLENVLLPTHAFKDGGSREERARKLLDRVGLSHRLDHRPAELSGGERQRTAIARALINEPALLLCDEPTGNLDEKTADSVANLLFELHKEENNAMIIVTHDPDLAKRCARQTTLHEGKLQELEAVEAI